MEIRLGKREDSFAIKSIDSSLSSDSSRADFIDSSIQEGTLRVAVNNDEIVGYSVVNKSFFRRPTLEMLMVAEGLRRSSIGRALLRDAQTLSSRELWTSTNESNTPMRSLLEAEGFEMTGRIEKLDPGDPELVYLKQLVET